MRRRDLLVGTAAAVVAAPNVARAQTPKVRWRLASSFPRTLKLLFKGCEQFSKRVEELTGGEMQIQVFAGGDIVPPLGVFDSVSAGTVECGHTLSLYYTGKNKALAFESGVPFGMTARQHSAWMLAGGGLDLTRELMAKYNIVNFPFGNTGAQMGGWFRKEITSLNDFKGMRMRIPGLGSFVLSRLGVVPQNIPASDTYSALERGTIDSVEWVGPYDDEVLGYYKVAKYYYFPGFWDCAAQNSLYVNKAAWESLPQQYKSAIEVASHESYTTMLADYDTNNMLALRRLLTKGVEVKPFPKDFLEAAYKETFRMYEEDQKQNPDFAKIYGPWLDFREKIINWFRISEGSYEFFVYNQRKS